jgi:AraC-like DNA-binding protein
LYDFDVGTEALPARCHVEAWVPGIPGIREVFHARMVDYAYPAHCHDTWAILIVDDGAITYDLDHRERFAAGSTVTVLPPGVPHDGGPAPGAEGFRKREFYLDETLLPRALAGAAVDRASLSDGPLRAALSRLHDRLVLDGPDLTLGAEAGISLIAERVAGHLAGLSRAAEPASGPVARRLREFLDSRVRDDVRLAEAAVLLDRSVPHLVRSFTREFGLSPYAYVLGRRIDAARALLLRGAAPAEVAAAVGFYDQAHFTRHFKRHTSVTPAAYARSHARARR